MTEDIGTIPFETIRVLRDKLKKLDTKWVRKVAIRMLINDPEKKFTEEILLTDDQEAQNAIISMMAQVRNICNNIIRHNTRKAPFVIAADAVLQELMEIHSVSQAIAVKHTAPKKKATTHS